MGRLLMRLFASFALVLALASGAGGVSAAESLSPEEVARVAETNPEALGSLSLGRPYAGALVNGVQLTSNRYLEVMQPVTAWATEETRTYLEAAVAKVHREFPESHAIFVGDVSREPGGRLNPHASHQAGRDADISYFYLPGKQHWYQPAASNSLDLPRTWALLRALITETDLEVAFVDLRVQNRLYDYARANGEDAAWLDQVFGYRGKNENAPIRHAWGHYTHIHVRFYNPRAQEVGRLAFAPLVEHSKFASKVQTVRYRMRSGETAESVAARVGCSARSLRVLNSGEVNPGQVIRVPLRGLIAAVNEVVVPPRMIPSVSPPHAAAPRLVTNETR